MRTILGAVFSRPAIICLLLLLALFNLAAVEHQGRVTFNGLPVPGVTVTATQAGKRLTAVTDQQGAYGFPDLAEGIWTIRVEMLCFAPIEREVAVTPAAPRPEWQLQMLPLAEMHSAAAPPAPAAVATASAALGQPQAAAPATPPAPTARGKKNAIPTVAPPQNGFQKADVKASEDAAKAEKDSDSQAVTEASKESNDGFLINGSVNNGANSAFSQSAAFGNFRPGGRGLYNGGIGFTMDNSNLDASPFSITGQNTPKLSYNRFTGLGTFGGPLKLPGMHSNWPTIFVAYQWTRNHNDSVQTGLMPTEAERTGDLTGVLNLLGQPVQIAGFPENKIPQSLISPQAAALLSLYPQPNFGGSAGYNYQIPSQSATHQDSLQSRFNKMLNRKNMINGGFNMQDSRSDTPNLFDLVDVSHTLGLNGYLNWRHFFSQRFTSSFSYSYSHYSSHLTPYFANKVDVSGDFGITGNDQSPVDWGPPSLQFSSGIAGLSDAQASNNRFQTSAVSANLFWLHGAHNISFGGDFRRQQFNYLTQQNARGNFTFTGAATEVSANGSPVPASGSDFADFLLGVPDTASIAFGNADKYFRDSVSDAFVSDDWRVAPGLSLNLGLRWEYGAPVTEEYGRMVNLDVGPGFSAVAPVLASDPVGSLTGQHYPDSLLRPDRHAFQPRVAVAWHPLLGSSMVVRAGYGIYYNTSFYQPLALQLAQQSPLSKSLTVANTAADPLTLVNGFIPSPTTTQNTFAIDPNLRAGYSHNWNLSVQRDLPGSLVATLTYLGIKGTRGMQMFLPNTYPLGADNPCPACPAGFLYVTSNGNSTRESGQAQLRRRLHNGLMASLQYTFAKAIDDSTLGGRGQGGTLIAQNWLDLDGERGLSNFDQRHTVNATLQYTTGMGVGGGTLVGGWRGAAFKDWTFVVTPTAATGMPLTPIYTAIVSGTGVTGSIRPEYTGAPLYSSTSGRNLNPAAYTAPPEGEWGDAGRNSITGPAQFSLNASMARTFRVTDRWNADLRFDATNVLNHVTYPNWVTTVTDIAQFGLPLTANAMRAMQVTLRMRF
ncbi:MAG: TonB-dependent receptor [Bryobacteraceae bacterium]